MTTVSSAVRSAFLLVLIFLSLLLPLLTGGCARTTTRLQPVAPERVAAEERVQRELVLTELARAQGAWTRSVRVPSSSAATATG